MYIDMTLLTLFGGFTELWNLVVDMVPPNFDNMRVVLKATVETIWMALIGTTACVVLSIPLAFMAARNTTPNPVVFAVARAIITLTRALPTLVLAAVLTLPLGIGPLPGLLALAIHSIGMVGKLFTEAVENTEAMSREAVTSTGAGKWQIHVEHVERLAHEVGQCLRNHRGDELLRPRRTSGEHGLARLR
ncbi:MAG: ABC transporter permease subunit [Acidimicrobiia bacterium]|nr:ABC transporter permease subunit [Acidimicrobiia bacterium]